jgi:uncharacterized protein YdhG (YjbR/CyaY superfamily)
MHSKAQTVEQYISELPVDRKEAIEKLRKVIKDNLPPGFVEEMSYGMIGYVVPHSKYPNGYHVNSELPLPFINIASQKNHIALYHMGLYANEPLMKWFTADYPKYVSRKLDMGKSCIRFKKPEHIPFELIGQLASKTTVNDYIKIYESQIQNLSKKK